MSSYMHPEAKLLVCWTRSFPTWKQGLAMIRKKIAQILFMLPEQLKSRAFNDIRQELEEVVTSFETFFEDKEFLFSQVRVLQNYLKSRPGVGDVSNLYKEAFKFSEVRKLLQIVLTHPVTSCEAERSFSTMRRLFNWLRSSMLTSRLNHLAVCHIHRARLYQLPNSDIKKTFIERKRRRLDYGGSFMFNLLTSSVLLFQFQQLIPKMFEGEIVYLVSNQTFLKLDLFSCSFFFRLSLNKLIISVIYNAILIFFSWNVL